MNKRMLSLICAFAIVLGMIIPSTAHVHAVTDNTCVCGKTDVEWETLAEDTVFEANGHYRLEGDVTRSVSATTKFEGTFCIDLAGHTLSRDGRVFILGAEDGAPATVLNILDSSADHSGEIRGSGSKSYVGGLFYINANAVCNLYGGTIQPSTANEEIAYTGGIFAVFGTLNVYGGTIIGGKLGGTNSNAHVGATVVVRKNGSLNLYGGIVQRGTAESDELGNCVCVNDGGRAKLSGDARVDEITFRGEASEALTVSGIYTGSATLRLANEIASGAKVANSDGADISGATLSIVGSTLDVAVSGNSIMVGEMQECPVCDELVIWENITKALPTTADGHYRLSGDVTVKSQTSITGGGKICLDLAGYTYSSAGRTFILGKNSQTNGEVLNIMDSSAGQTGRVIGRGGSSSMASGVIYSYQRTEVNIYSGTIEAVGNGNVIAENGGAIDTYGSINMYGGKVIGNHVAKNGGTICLLSKNSVFNMEGGTLVSGKADELGDCVYVHYAEAQVKLSGNACPEQIYFANSSASSLVITGEYTGTTELKYAKKPAAGADIGNCDNAVMGKENITIFGSRLYGVVSGDNLVATALTGASVTDQNGNVAYYDTLAEAVAAWTKGSVVKLLADNEENITISGDMTLDLSGWDMAGDITIGGTLYVKDSATDDHTVEDLEGYGVISGRCDDAVKADAEYLLVEDTDGISAHHYVLALSKVNLRPGSAGMYYTGDIVLDEIALQRIDRFGVAVSVSSKTPEATPEATGSLYTAYTKEQYGKSSTASTLINAVMKTANASDTNEVYAATNVYGRAYILLDNGKYLYSDVCGTNLQQLTEIVDSKAWGKLSLVQNRALMSMYDTYQEPMEDWSLTNMAASVAKKNEAADDDVLKAIIIGNSASSDVTRLLAAIFQKEAPDQKFVLGCMYESGCPIEDHISFFESDAPVYTYYKNTGANDYGAWDAYSKSTLKQGLEDQNWDIVIFQEMHTITGLPETFTGNNNLETLITHVVNTLGYEPQLDWHSVGIIPEIPQNYVDYVTGVEGDDGGGTNAGENEGWEDDGEYQPEDMAWIFDIARPGYPVSWAKNYIKNFNNDAQTMYDAICDVAVKHIMNNEVYGFTDVIPGGSVIQYARNMGMTDQQLFRDYAHKSDYGRVLIGYVMYASLMGITEFEALQYTTVPKQMRHEKFAHLGDLVLSDEQYKMALDAVNYALKNPFDSPDPVTAE